MGKLTELEQWEDDIYQIETSDPVLGGPDGITNKPARQLSNRTQWLKAQLAAANKALEVHERSRNHPDATLTEKGFTKLYSGVISLDETMAATPKAVKIAMDNANARLAKERNGADIPNVALFRQNIELGNSATRNVGQIVGTVAAGDDSRILAAKKAIDDTQTGLMSQPLLRISSPDDLSNLPAGAHRFAINATVAGRVPVLPLNNYVYLEVIAKRDTANGTAIRITEYNNPANAWTGTRSSTSTETGFTWAKNYNTLSKPTPADIGTDTTAQINTKVADAKKAGTDAQLTANSAATAAANANTNANSRVPATRTVNGKPLSTNIIITSQDIFNGQTIYIGADQNLNNYKTAGIYYQSANANTSLALNYPEALAGTLLVFKNAGITQVYYVYNSSRVYTRSQYTTGNFTPWAREYNTQNKPSAADVGAVPTSRTINGKSLLTDLILTAADLGITIPSVPKNTALIDINGWWKCGDTGLIIQWGIVRPPPIGYSTVNVPLPTNFPNKGLWAFGYVAAAMPYDNDAISGSAGLLGTAPNTTIRVTTDNDTPTAWLAIGY